MTSTNRAMAWGVIWTSGACARRSSSSAMLDFLAVTSARALNALFQVSQFIEVGVAAAYVEVAAHGKAIETADEQLWRMAGRSRCHDRLPRQTLSSHPTSLPTIPRKHQTYGKRPIAGIYINYSTSDDLEPQGVVATKSKSRRSRGRQCRFSAICTAASRRWVRCAPESGLAIV